MNLKRALGVLMSPCSHGVTGKVGEASLKLFINLNNLFKIFIKFNSLNTHMHLKIQ